MVDMVKIPRSGGTGRVHRTAFLVAKQMRQGDIVVLTSPLT
jgi:hypothetical protein